MSLWRSTGKRQKCRYGAESVKGVLVIWQLGKSIFQNLKNEDVVMVHNKKTVNLFHGKVVVNSPVKRSCKKLEC